MRVFVCARARTCSLADRAPCRICSAMHTPNPDQQQRSGRAGGQNDDDNDEEEKEDNDDDDDDDDEGPTCHRDTRQDVSEQRCSPPLSVHLVPDAAAAFKV